MLNWYVPYPPLCAETVIVPLFAIKTGNILAFATVAFRTVVPLS